MARERLLIVALEEKSLASLGMTPSFGGSGRVLHSGNVPSTRWPEPPACLANGAPRTRSAQILRSTRILGEQPEQADERLAIVHLVRTWLEQA